MPIYEISAPNGKTYQIEGPDGATREQVIAAILARDPSAANPPKPSGGIGTPAALLRGLVPGAVGALETGITGLASVLPESAEQAVRGATKSVADVIRKPFAEAAGKEDTVLRRLGESVGSVGPFLAAGPFGAAGRLGAMGLGVAMGAGEARTRAEEAGATADERGTATALGILPGAMEALPPLRILNRLNTAAPGSVNTLRRALIAGGEEGLQEAASNIAQNLIAKGVYNPQQGVFTDTGEALGYGAGTGALVSALMDLTLGRRSRGAAPAPAAEPPAAPSAAPSAPAVPELAQMSTAQLYQEEGRLASMLDAGDRRPEIAKRIKALRELRRQREIEGIEALRGQKVAQQAEAARAEETSLGQAEPVQGEFRETMLAPYEERALQAQQQEAPAPVEAKPETAPVGEQFELPGVTPLSDTVTPERLVQAGLPAQPKTLKQKGVAQWANDNLVGKPIDDVRALVQSQPELIKGNSLRATVLRNLTVVTPPPFEEAEIGRSAEPDVSEPSVDDLRGRIPSLAIPDGLFGNRREPVAAAEPAAPVDGGVEPAGVPAAQGVVPERAEPAPVTPKRSAAEPPLKPGLTPEKEQQLRGKLNAQRATLRTLEAQRDAVEREYSIAELTGNEGAKALTGNALRTAEQALRKATTAADRTYWQLYDRNQSEAQAEEGRRLQEADEAAREARRTADMNVSLRERRGEYPYNLKTLRAVHDELRDQLSHTPEYKEFIEKNFTQDRSRVKNKKNEAKVIAEGQKLLDRMVFQTKLSGKEVPLTPAAIEEIEGGSISAALLELADTTADPAYKAMAERLVPLLRNTKITIEPKLLNNKGARARGATSTSGRRVWLDREFGLNEETLLHESVHAASEAILDKKPADRTAQQNVAINELNKLWEAAKADADITLSADAQKSISEFVTEALTSPALVEQLKKKPWTIKNAWESFKTILLKALGVQFPSNMYEAAMASMDTIFTAPKPLSEAAEPPAAFRMAPDIQQTLESLEPGTPQRRSFIQMITGAYPAGTGPMGQMSQSQISRLTQVRTKISDKAATVFEKLNNAVLKGMISEVESRESQALFKQGEAKNQLVPEYMRTGNLEIDSGTKLFQAVSKQGIVAPAEVFQMVEAWGKKQGLTMDKAWAYAARLIESGRQHEFRRLNALSKPGDPKFPVTANFPIDTLYAVYKADKDLLAIKDVLDKARLRLIDQMVQVGRISKAEAAEWAKAAEYIPFDRLTPEQLGEFGNALRSQKRTGKGLTSLGSLPRLVDAAMVGRPVGNALENYFGTLGWMVEQTVQTHALNQTVAMLHKIGEAHPRGKNPNAVRDASLRVMTYRHGAPFYYEMPTPFHALAFNAQVAPLPGILRVFGNIARTLRTSITALPTFTASQLPQDIQRAIVYSGVQNPALLTAKATANFGALMKHAVRGTLAGAKEIQALSSIGVVGDVDFRTNEPAKSLLVEFGYDSPTLLKSKKLGTLLHRLNEVSRASDIAIRKAIYDQTIEETGDKLLAAARAREIINFRTSGAGDSLHILPTLIQTIPFFNAYIQGTDVLVRWLLSNQAVSGLAKAKAQQQMRRMAGAVTTAGLAYALLMSGDDEYENMSLEERDRTWVIGKGLGVPVPSEIGMLFKALPERIVDYVSKQGTPDERAGSLAISTWLRAAFWEYAGNRSVMPAAIKPTLETWFNYSTRTGRELEGTYLSGLDPSQRTKEGTSEFAKAVANFASQTIGLEVSPVKIDHVLNGYFGTSAALTLATIDALTSDRADRPLHQIVGLTPFTYDTTGPRKKTEFYELQREVTRAQNTLNALMKRDPQAALDYAEKNQEKFILYKAVNGTLQHLEKTRASLQWLDTSAAAEQMSGAERAETKRQIREYEQKLVEWTREAGQALGL